METVPLDPEKREALIELRERARNVSNEDVYTNDSCLLRILKARDFKVNPAFEMWLKWVDWRKSYRADSITEDEMMPHIRTGKAFYHGEDKSGRPCLIVRVRNHWPQDFTPEETMRYSIYLVEKGVKMADEKGVGQICVIYDRGQITEANQDPNLINLFKQLTATLQDFYAERLGALYVLHINWFYWLIYHTVKPTLPKATREKLNVLRTPKSLRDHFEMSQLMQEYTGGDPYVHPYPST